MIDEEFVNIINDDPDFDEEELFRLECHPHLYDKTTEVLVSDNVKAMLENDEDSSEDVFILDEIPTVSIVSDESVTIFSKIPSSSEASVLICKTCS